MFKHRLKTIAKMATLALVLGIPLFNFTGCSDKMQDDKPCVESNTVKQVQLFKDFYIYKPGSWWIYQNLADTTITDSFWVSRYEEGYVNNTVQNHDYSNPYCFETINMQLQSKMNYTEPYFIGRKLSLSTNSSPENPSGRFSDYFYSNSSSGIYFLYINDSMYSQESASGLSYRIIADSVIHSRKYTDLVSFYYPSIIKEIGWYKELTFAKHIGPVYFEEINGSRWSLIRYNVVQ
ncbi:MAG: hypothetical protein EP332_04000 [Bacteroidetes bacterium]|nr:MAG: hypothetical protein EP332_04000 [Bacteroidota bacterium]